MLLQLLLAEPTRHELGAVRVAGGAVGGLAAGGELHLAWCARGGALLRVCGQEGQRVSELVPAQRRPLALAWTKKEVSCNTHPPPRREPSRWPPGGSPEASTADIQPCRGLCARLVAGRLRNGPQSIHGLWRVVRCRKCLSSKCEQRRCTRLHLPQSAG